MATARLAQVHDALGDGGGRRTAPRRQSRRLVRRAPRAAAAHRGAARQALAGLDADRRLRAPPREAAQNSAMLSLRRYWSTTGSAARPPPTCRPPRARPWPRLGRRLGRRLGHQLQDRDVGLARQLVVPGLVAHHDLEQLVHRLGEAAGGEVRLRQLEAGVEVALVGGDRGRQRVGAARRRRPSRCAASQWPSAARRGVEQRLARPPARTPGAPAPVRPRSSSSLHVVEARGVVGRVDGHRLLQLVERGVGVALGDQRLGLLGLAPRPPASSLLGTCLSRNCADLRLGQRADEAVDRLALVEQHAERDAAHAERLAQLAGDLGLLVAVELGQLEAAGVGALELFEHRAERLARAAPGRPDVEQHRLLHRGVDQFGFEVLEGDVDHGGSGGARPVRAAPPTIQALFMNSERP